MRSRRSNLAGVIQTWSGDGHCCCRGAWQHGRHNIEGQKLTDQLAPLITIRDLEGCGKGGYSESWR